jgi:uncharacterized membrane protein YbaN (DUF454 family)
MDISSDDIKNYLDFKDEEPQVIAHKYISDITEKYRYYKKVPIRRKKIQVIYIIFNISIKYWINSLI